MRKVFSMLILCLPVIGFAMEDLDPSEYGEHYLQALLMCDTSDPKTKESHLADIKRVEENLRGIASQCHLKLVVKVFKDKEIKVH